MFTYNHPVLKKKKSHNFCFLNLLIELNFYESPLLVPFTI